MCRISLILTASLVLLAGCRGEADRTGSETSAADASSAAASEARSTNAQTASDLTAEEDVALPPGHPPIGQPAVADDTGLPAGHPPIGQPPAPQTGGLPQGHPPVGPASLRFEVPADWREQTPGSLVRKYQYALPAAEGAPDEAEVIVFFFGRGQGGPLENNIERWRGQFSQDGAPLGPDAMQRDEFEADGRSVTVVELAGDYNSAMMPDMPGGDVKAGYRMIAGVIQETDGNWFVRALGPDATIAAQRDAVRTFIRSAHR